MPSAAGYVDVVVNKSSAHLRAMNPRVGFDFSLIITTLLPLIASCFNRSPERSQDPREFLQDNYDELTATFDRSLIERVRPQTRRAVREAHKSDKSLPRVMHRDMLDQVSHQSLYQAMTAPQSQFAACFAQLSVDAGDAGLADKIPEAFASVDLLEDDKSE